MARFIRCEPSGGADQARTRGQEGPIVIELKYREKPRQPITSEFILYEAEDGRTRMRTASVVA